MRSLCRPNGSGRSRGRPTTARRLPTRSAGTWAHQAEDRASGEVHLGAQHAAERCSFLLLFRHAHCKVFIRSGVMGTDVKKLCSASTDQAS